MTEVLKNVYLQFSVLSGLTFSLFDCGRLTMRLLFSSSKVIHVMNFLLSFPNEKQKAVIFKKTFKEYLGTILIFVGF